MRHTVVVGSRLILTTSVSLKYAKILNTQAFSLFASIKKVAAATGNRNRVLVLSSATP